MKLHTNKLPAGSTLGILLISCSIFTGCSQEEIYPGNDQKNILTISVNLENSLRASRAIFETQDGWSVTSFQRGDEVGLYSSAGNNKVDNGNGPFINVPLSFTRAVSSSNNSGESGSTNYQFDNEDLEMDRSKFLYDHTSLYYPYSEDMNTTGLLLREKKDGEGPLRCLDFLFMDHLLSSKLLNEQQLAGNFNHIFSELIIVRGEGFSEASDKTITVVMSEAYSHVKLVDNETNFNQDAWKIPQLVYNASCGMTEKECKNWEAWQGENYTPSFTGATEMEAWYVILPTMLSNNRTSIDHIEIYDDSGNLQKISSFSLYNGTKQLPGGWKYPIEIKMEGLVPTVNPYQILQWEEETDVTDERKAGISDASEFEDWVGYYNNYKLTGDDQYLEDFGDKIMEEGTTTWCFYLLNDIDLGNKKYNLSKFSDILDGLGNTISNLSLTSSFIDSFEEKGEIINLNFQGLTVNSDSPDPVGGLIKNMSGGIIQRVNIDATVIGNSSVGMLAATLSGGQIEDSTFSGLLIGSGSYTSASKYLFATQPSGSFKLSNNNCSGILFTYK